MEPLSNRPSHIERYFLGTGLLLLTLGMLFGIAGSFQYLIPGLWKPFLSFERIRPLHVSSVVFWILFASISTVLTYFQEYSGKQMYSKWLLRIQWYLFLFAVICILLSYFAGVFGGREYWEFPPVLALPIVAGWILFIFNMIKTVGHLRQQPVYVWMWLTGCFFFLFTFLESYLWIFPFFRNNVIRDMTIQWKSYGSMVGAWNMLIYGSGIYLMEKISEKKTYSQSKIAFILYFTGLFNLMFNWGHHIYTLPTFHFIQYISYAVSMTELFIFGRIIWIWRSTVTEARRHFHITTYRFIVGADVWIFLVLLQALLMSIPAINLYTHGTHITVAHTMGATIGINTLMLMAFTVDMLENKNSSTCISCKWIKAGFWIVNISLFIFWISLIVAGIVKAKWQMSTENISFTYMMQESRLYFIIFCVSGIALTIGFCMILFPLIGDYKRKVQNENRNKATSN